MHYQDPPEFPCIEECLLTVPRSPDTRVLPLPSDNDDNGELVISQIIYNLSEVLTFVLHGKQSCTGKMMNLMVIPIYSH